MRKTLAVAVIASLTVVPVFAKAPAPKVPEPRARATALALVKGGTVKSEELETEHGQLIYSYDIIQPNVAGVEEVQISAITGKLVARHHETAAKEQREAVIESVEAKLHKPK
jgi:hypothetical protein